MAMPDYMTICNNGNARLYVIFVHNKAKLRATVSGYSAGPAPDIALYTRYTSIYTII